MIRKEVIQQKRFVGYLICLGGFASTLAAFYPGMMSPDSIASLAEGRSGIIYDQNSAIMSFLWGGLDQLVAGPGLMFTLQVGVFWVAVACLWEAVHRESLALGIASVLFPLLPHVLSQLPIIWKDVGMAVALLMSVALIFLAKKKRSKSALLLSPLFLFYAFAARLNSVPAVLPIAVWTGFVAVAVFELGRGRMMSAAIGSAYFVVLLAAVLIVQSLITGGRTSYPFQYVHLYDLAAISIRNNEPRFPQYVIDSPNFSMEEVRTNYTPTTVGRLVYTDQSRNGQAVLTVVETQEKINELRTVWRQQLLSDPVGYVTHRAAVFLELIGLGRSVALQYWDPALNRNVHEFAIEKNPVNRLIMAYFSLFQRPFMQTFFFRGILWILACCFLVYRATRSRLSGDWDFVLVLSISSLLYIFSYFFTAPAADFRYIYWPAVASTIAVIFGIYLLKTEREGRNSTTVPGI